MVWNSHHVHGTSNQPVLLTTELLLVPTKSIKSGSDGFSAFLEIFFERYWLCRRLQYLLFEEIKSLDSTIDSLCYRLASPHGHISTLDCDLDAGSADEVGESLHSLPKVQHCPQLTAAGDTCPLGGQIPLHLGHLLQFMGQSVVDFKRPSRDRPLEVSELPFSKKGPKFSILKG